jgi:hypothetical protein
MVPQVPNLVLFDWPVASDCSVLSCTKPRHVGGGLSLMQKADPVVMRRATCSERGTRKAAHRCSPIYKLVTSALSSGFRHDAHRLLHAWGALGAASCLIGDNPGSAYAPSHCPRPPLSTLSGRWSISSHRPMHPPAARLCLCTRRLLDMPALPGLLQSGPDQRAG